MERGRNRCRSHFFQILDIWSHSGDIRDQSRKLSKIALNVGRFFALPNFRGRPSKSYTHIMTPVPWHVVWKLFCGDTPTSPEVIVANTLNFKSVNFHDLHFCGGPPSQLGCALGCLGQSVTRIKISGRSTPCSTPWGPRCSLPRKIHLGGSMLPNKTFLFADQSSPDFFHRTRE